MGRSEKIRKINFRCYDGQFEDPVVMVADYVFGDSHSESSVSWLFRKLERYQNYSSFTRNSYRSTEKEDDTTSSRLNTAPPPASQKACMTFKQLLKVNEGFSSDNFAPHTSKSFNGVSNPTLSSNEITSIMTRLRKDVE